MHLYSYILKATTNLISALQIFSRKCSKSKGFSKFQKFQNKSLENWLFLFNLTGLLFRIFNKSRAQEKCFLWVPWDNCTVPRKRSIIKSFSSKLEISVQNLRAFSENNFIFTFVSVCFKKNAVSKVPENSQKNVFSRLPFKQFELSYLAN